MAGAPAGRDQAGQGPDGLIQLAEIVAAHGVKGLVRVRTFTGTPSALLDYGGLVDGSGRPVRIDFRGQSRGGLLAAVDGVTDRTGAEALKGTKLFIARSALPSANQEEGEYYQADLIGLAVELTDGSRLGRVEAVHDFGAGDVLEIGIAARRGTVLVPFTHEVVPVVDLAGRRVVVDPLPGLLD